MKSFIPNKKQWKSWSMPSKVGFIGTVLSVISFFFAIYVWIFPGSPLGNDEKWLDVTGTVLLDEEPLTGAVLSIHSNQGKWTSGENGSFDFKIPNNGTDSVSLTVLHTTEFETLRIDTTLVKTSLQGLQFHMRTGKLQTIAGRVLEQGTGKPIVGAKIVLEAGRGDGISNDTGAFSFTARGKAYERVSATISHTDYMPGLTLSKNNQIVLTRK